MTYQYLKNHTFPLCLLVALAWLSTTVQAAEEHSAQLNRGGLVVINVFELCSTENVEHQHDGIQILNEPTEGFLFSGTVPGTLDYQHSGTSDIDDRFSVQTGVGDKHCQIDIILKINKEMPSLNLIQPADTQEIEGNQIEVLFTVSGKGADHVHLSLGHDGEHVSIDVDKGKYIFEKVKPGVYTIYASLANNSHRTIPGTEIAVSVVVDSKD